MHKHQNPSFHIFVLLSFVLSGTMSNTSDLKLQRLIVAVPKNITVFHNFGVTVLYLFFRFSCPEHKSSNIHTTDLSLIDRSHSGVLKCIENVIFCLIILTHCPLVIFIIVFFRDFREQ